MKKRAFHLKLSTYRYEFLLAALLLLIFDKVFFPDQETYLRIVWPANMVLIGLACAGIYMDKKGIVNVLRHVLTALAILMPLGFILWSRTGWFVEFLTIFYIIFYSFIFVEVMIQITAAREVRLNVVIGSFCGYLLLSMVALFCYLVIELNYPKSFSNITYGELASVYNQLSYFSFITLTSIGFGDICPLTDMSRLTVAFFGMLGQFYMVAVIGIVISKFTSTSA